MVQSRLWGISASDIAGLSSHYKGSVYFLRYDLRFCAMTGSQLVTVGTGRLPHSTQRTYRTCVVDLCAVVGQRLDRFSMCTTWLKNPVSRSHRFCYKAMSHQGGNGETAHFQSALVRFKMPYSDESYWRLLTSAFLRAYRVNPKGPKDPIISYLGLG